MFPETVETSICRARLCSNTKVAALPRARKRSKLESTTSRRPFINCTNAALITSLCRELDLIPVLDPLKALRKEHLAGHESYFQKDMHWNPDGHAIVGRELAPWIASLLHD